MAKRTKRASGGIAVGAYLRVLRMHAGLSPTQLAAQIGIDPTQVWRIETWRVDPRSSVLLAFVAVVRGDVRDVARLIADSAAGSEEGETAARMRIRELGG
jgi:DNA-binding XRE family transcriptional regulator